MATMTRTRKNAVHQEQDPANVYTTQIKRRPGRPKRDNISAAQSAGRTKGVLRSQNISSVQAITLDLEERRERLQAIQQQLSVGDMFLSGMSIADISNLTGLEENEVLVQIRALEDVMFAKLAVLTERLTYLNVGRLERLMSVWMPLALQADESATRQVLSIQKSEIDWAERISAKQHPGSRDELYNFEQTVSTQGNLYLSAATSVEKEWLDDAEIAVSDLYAEDIPDVDSKGLRDDIAELERKLGFEPEPASDSD